MAINNSACLNCKIISMECKLLRCCHSLCSDCLLHYENNGVFHCPECQLNTKFSDLRYNFVLAEVMNCLQFNQKFREEQNCQICSTSPPKRASYYCIDCHKLMCMNDYYEHHNVILPPYHHHHVIKHDSQPYIQNLLDGCRHQNNLQYYCMDDKQAICTCCAKKEHTGHNYKSISDVHKNLVGEIKTNLETISKQLRKINTYIESLENMNSNLETYEKREVGDIIERYDELIREIQKKQKQELQKLFRENEQKRTSLSNAILQIKQLKTLLKQTYKFTSSSLFILSPHSLIIQSNFLKHRTDQIIAISYEYNFNHSTDFLQSSNFNSLLMVNKEQDAIQYEDSPRLSPSSSNSQLASYSIESSISRSPRTLFFSSNRVTDSCLTTSRTKVPNKSSLPELTTLL